MRNQHAADRWDAYATVYDRVFVPLTGYIARSTPAAAETRMGALEAFRAHRSSRCHRE